MSASIISFVNLKGGVGKTALAVNVAVSLAAELGQKVLVIDLDQQSNASIWIMGQRAWINRANHQYTKTVYGLICHGEPLGECIVKSPITNEEGNIEAETLDLMPSTYQLISFEENYRQREGQPQPYVRFYQHIKIVREQYDFIIIDCPPNTHRATKCGIFASDYIFVPCNPDSLSWIGLELLSKRIRNFSQKTQAELNTERPGEAVPLVSGVIINDVDPTAKALNRQATERLETRLNHLKKGGHVRTDSAVLDVQVRHAAALQRGSFTFRPILFSEPHSSNLEADYRQLATFFYSRLKR